MRVRRAEGLTQQLRKVERTLILKLPKSMAQGIRYSKKMGRVKITLELAPAPAPR